MEDCTFVDAVKYYYLQQTGSDNLNLDISAQSWNTNLDNSIRKWFFVDGTIGSTTATSAASLSGTVNNLSIKISVSGAIYGKAGDAGTNGVNGGVGGDGAPALSWTATSNNNNYIILLSGSKLYAGGGGGGQGGSGGGGGRGGNGGKITFSVSLDPQCLGVDGGGPGGSTKPGADGGQGAGYANQTPNLLVVLVGEINGGQGYSGPAGNGGSGGNSGG